MGEFGEEFDQLDAELTNAINTAMDGRPDDLAKRLFNRKESYVKDFQETVTGRQLLWVIDDSYKVGPNSGVLFGIQDLAQGKDARRQTGRSSVSGIM
eukprot:12911583-Heterocapsa_arctica.AAC.1